MILKAKPAFWLKTPPSQSSICLVLLGAATYKRLSCSSSSYFLSNDCLQDVYSNSSKVTEVKKCNENL